MPPCQHPPKKEKRVLEGGRQADRARWNGGSQSHISIIASNRTTPSPRSPPLNKKKKKTPQTRSLPPVPHPRGIAAGLLRLLHRQEPVAALLPPAAAIPVLFIKLTDRAQTAHVLAHARADFLHRFLEMPLVQRALLRIFEILRSTGLCGVEFLAHAGERGGDGEVFEVGAGVEGCLGREGGKGDGGVEELVFEVNLEDFLAVFFKREVDEEAAREAAKGGFVEVEGAVGGDHDEGGHVVHAVPFAEELVDEFAVAGAVAGAPTGAENGIGFVDEDDAGGEFLR